MNFYLKKLMRACKLYKMCFDVYHLAWKEYSDITDYKKSKRHRSAEKILSST